MSSANSDQAEFWNEDGGQNWIAHHQALDAQIRPFGLAAMEAAGFAEGAQLLDVGCGCGPTTIELGSRVGPEGSVVGVDISEVMIDESRNAAARAGATNVSFQVKDMQVDKLDQELDGAFSRFGVMFFADPTRAFANIRKAVRVGGTIAFVAWQDPGRNPWMIKPMLAMGEHIKLPPRPAPGEPGPFSFGDPELVKGYMNRAGFTSIEVQGSEIEMTTGGGDIEGTIDFLMAGGRTGAAIAEGGPSLAAAIRESMRKVVEPTMIGAAWIVTARA